VNALANPEVGEYLNRDFVSTFQKVGTFRVTGNQKQGGNVASYFCTPTGNVLDAIAGPVDAPTLLREARWVVETRKMALLDSGGNSRRYRLFFRMAHAQRLAEDNGVRDVNWRALPLATPTAAALTRVLDHDPHMHSLNAQGKVHLLLADFPLVNLAQAYRPIYEKILGEKVTTVPVLEGNEPAPTTAEGSTWQPPPTAAVPVSLRRGSLDPDLVGAGALSREEARARELDRARDNPPRNEVCSGKALNVILADLVRRRTEGAVRPVQIPAEVLPHLNVIVEHEHGNPGLLRRGGRLPWPAVWDVASLRDLSRQPRAEADELLAKAVAQARKGEVHGAVLEKLHRDLDFLRTLLNMHLGSLETSASIRAERFLDDLAAAVKVLGSDNAGRYLDGSLALNPERIRTVVDLVHFMAGKDLVFAPAVAGDEAAYTLVQRALAAADREDAVAAADAGGL
jgi:hypothetical protein